MRVVYSPLASQEQYSQDFSKSITFIPLKYFYSKQKGSELFSFSTTSENEEKKIQLILDVDIDNNKLADWSVLFFKKPQWTAEDNIQELCKKDIIKQNVQSSPFIMMFDVPWEPQQRQITYVEGPKGFFAETLKKNQEEELKQKAKVWASRIKKFCGFSVAVIIVYILCRKLYATAH